jgi:hypothetical protein
MSEVEAKQSLCSLVFIDLGTFPNHFGCACEIEQVASVEIHE